MVNTSQDKSKPELALIVDDEITNRLILKTFLKQQGIDTVEAVDGLDAIESFKNNLPDMVFMDVIMPKMDGYEATIEIKKLSKNSYVPIIFLTSVTEQEELLKCIEVGGDDFISKPLDKFLMRAKIEAIRRNIVLAKELQGMYSMIHREQEIGEQVFNNAVQKENIDNENIRTLIKPATTFSGDMILSAYAPSRDLHFLLGDFTGHGLSAALGALPVSEVFRAMTSKGFSIEEILIGINKKLKAFLPTGMFLGVGLVSISHDLEHVKIINAGMPELYLIDGQTHKIKAKVKSSSLPLGVIENIDSAEMVQYLPINHGDKLICYSDGLTEAWSPEGVDYGEDRFKNSIQTTAIGQSIFDQVFDDLANFCEDAVQADDITLAELTCVQDIMPKFEGVSDVLESSKKFISRGEWDYSISFQGARLRETNPVPLIINNLLELENIEPERQNLFTVLTELYVNALDHGVLNLNSSLKSDPAGFAEYFSLREHRLADLESGQVSFHLSLKIVEEHYKLVIRVEDSGEGFDFSNQKELQKNELALSGRGLGLIRDLCGSLTYYGNGNIAEAVFSWDR